MYLASRTHVHARAYTPTMAAKLPPSRKATRVSREWEARLLELLRANPPVPVPHARWKDLFDCVLGRPERVYAELFTVTQVQTEAPIGAIIDSDRADVLAYLAECGVPMHRALITHSFDGPEFKSLLAVAISANAIGCARFLRQRGCKASSSETYYAVLRLRNVPDAQTSAMRAFVAEHVHAEEQRYRAILSATLLGSQGLQAVPHEVLGGIIAEYIPDPPRNGYEGAVAAWAHGAHVRNPPRGDGDGPDEEPMQVGYTS